MDERNPPLISFQEITKDFFSEAVFLTQKTQWPALLDFFMGHMFHERSSLSCVCVCVCVHVCGHVYCVGMRVHVGLSLCTWLCVYFCPCECLSLSLLVCMCAAWAKSSKADIWPEEQRGKNCLIQIEPRTLNYDTNTFQQQHFRHSTCSRQLYKAKVQHQQRSGSMVAFRGINTHLVRSSEV